MAFCGCNPQQQSYCVCVTTIMQIAMHVVPKQRTEASLLGKGIDEDVESSGHGRQKNGSGREQGER